MKNRFLSTLVLLIFSPQILAESFNKLANYAEAFTSLGEDNNYVDSQIINTASFFSQKIQAQIIPEENSTELRNAIAHCVFMKRGAYGDHFKNDEIHNLVIDKFHHTLAYGYDSSSPRQFFKIPCSQANSISSGIFGAPCIFAIQEGNQILMLQASATD